MPLVRHVGVNSNTEIGIWEITEDESYFDDHLVLYPKEINEIKNLSIRKKIEWKASRYLLHMMSGREIRGACLKDKYGKPFLENSSYHISMSHSHEMTAAIASIKNTGIDIQIIVPKITRIQHKFCSSAELSSIPDQDYVTYLHLYWGIKESLYKAYGKRRLNLKKDLQILPFEINKNLIRTHGYIRNRDGEQLYEAYGEIIGKYILTYVLEV